MGNYTVSAFRRADGVSIEMNQSAGEPIISGIQQDRPIEDEGADRLDRVPFVENLVRAL
jgi:hypothetical protein